MPYQIRLIYTTLSILFPLISHKIIFSTLSSFKKYILLGIPFVILFISIIIWNLSPHCILGYELLFTLGILIPLWPMRRKHKYFFWLILSISIICCILIIYPSITLPDYFTRWDFWNYKCCKWIGKGTYSSQLHLNQYKIAPFTWMLHRFGIIPTILLIMMYGIALFFYANYSPATKLLAKMINIHFILTVISCFFPGTHHLFNNLHLLVPFISYGKCSLLIGSIMLLLLKTK